MKCFAFVVSFAFLTCLLVKGIPIKCRDNRMCKTWNRKGFCRSGFYSTYAKVTNCPVECGFCKAVTRSHRTRRPVTHHSVGTTTTSPIDDETPYDIFKQSLNMSADPCDDFFQFTCGTYQATKAPEGKEAGRIIVDVQHDITQAVGDIIFKSDETSTLPAIQKMYAYKKVCMDLTRLNSETPNPRTQEFQTDLNNVFNGLPPMLTTRPPAFDLTNSLVELSKLHTGLSEPFFRTLVYKSASGEYRLMMLPGDLIMVNDEDYTKPQSAGKRQALKDYLLEIVGYLIADMPRAVDQPIATIKAAIEAAIQFEIDFATLTTSVDPFPADLAERDKVLEKKTVAEINTLIGEIDYRTYFHYDPANPDVSNPLYPAEVQPHLQDASNVYIYKTSLFTQINNLIARNPGVLANYIFLRLLHQSVPYLDTRFADAANRLAQKVDGKPYRSNRLLDCYDQVTKHFAMSVDYLFIEKYFDFEKKTKVDQLIENIRSGLKDMITEEKWLSEETRKKALDKLSKMRKLIGGAPYSLDEKKLEEYYSQITLNPADSYRTMVVKIMRHVRWREMMSLVIADYDEFSSIKAIAANAYNILNSNTVVIPAGITFLSNFSMAASNIYGGMGSIMGHEFSHGYDTNGANFNNDGNVEGILDTKHWWDASTKQEFQTRAECLEKQYSEVDIPDIGLKVDGKLTLAENIADNAGVRAAYRAYQKFLSTNKDIHIPGYKNFTNEQIFFISTGVVFCNWETKEYQKILQAIDNHAPNFARVNIEYANFPEFAKAFNCKEGSKMNPANRCEVW